MNSHSFTKTDVNNQHKTLDTIDNIPNWVYWESILNYYKKHNRYFIDEQKKFILMVIPLNL
jgi:hypothetical protein